MEDIEILNPYQGVDWDAVDYRIYVPHMHSYPSAGGSDNEEHHIVLDNFTGSEYLDIDYDAMAFGPKDDEPDDTDPFAFPWDTMGDRTDFESRDPAELGCCDLPYVEATNHGEHMNCLFGTEKDGQSGDRFDVYDAYLDQDDDAIVYPAHPERYMDDRSDWSRYIPDYRDYDAEQVPCWTVAAKTPDHTLWDFDDTDFLWDTWDSLISHFHPDRPVWGFAEDDCSSDESPGTTPSGDYDGNGFGMRFNVIPMEPDEFDLENDLEGTRQRFRQKILEGKAFPVRRDRWDSDSEDPTDWPLIESVTVDGNSISIETDGNVEWVSGTDSDGVRNVVETGDTIEVTGDCEPYVRAHVTTGNPEGETSTQPFGVLAPEEPQKMHNATIVSGSIGQS